MGGMLTIPMNGTTIPPVYLPIGAQMLDVGSNDSLKCNQYMYNNKTYIVPGGYEGIPDNLVINFIGWICLLALFTILRKNAWNYGRLALDQEQEKRWTHLFYRAEAEANKSGSGCGGDTEAVSSSDDHLLFDTGTFSWIPALFKIKDEHVRRKSGPDAVHYLSFQRHIIAYMSVVCVIGIAVVLPINFQGTLEGDHQKFGHTTISNLSPRSPLMWVHVTLAFLFLPLGIAFTRHHSRQLGLNSADLDPDNTSSVDNEANQSFLARTVMITHVPRRSCQKDTLCRHFQEAYPNVDVFEVQFAYSIDELITMDEERKLAHDACTYCVDYMERMEGERLLMSPHKCGVICGCCGRPKVDALEYYSEKKSNLELTVESEKVQALQRPTGVAFVTFDSRESANKILKDHNKTMPCRFSGAPPASSVSADLKPYNWLLRLAPAPSNIYWKNLSVRTPLWWAKAVLINLLLFVLLFFLTTPAVIMTTFEDFAHLNKTLAQADPMLSEFLPPLMLLTMAALMPVLVAYSDEFMSHWTRSAQNHAVMWKTFIFLLLMVVMLPSLGLTSARGLVEWIAHPSTNDAAYRWECVFLPDNGAFFVNYIITSAFIGTALELIRFPDLFMYIIRLSLVRSEAETASVRHSILKEFQFGVQYAWMLTIFAMTTIYSLTCPLITPFGLLYMVFKHLVDKYNIYFAYGPSRIGKNIHATAVHFVMVSIVLLQMSLFFFALLRLGITKPRSIYSLTLLCITGLVFILRIALPWLKNLGPIAFQNCDASSDAESSGDTPNVSEESLDAGATDGGNEGPNRTETGFFVPPVLKDNNRV